MAGYADDSDLALRWRVLTDAEKATADTLLGDAAVWLRTWFPDLDARIAAGALDPDVPVMVSCSMVKRAMLNMDTDGASAVQRQQTAGPFSDSTQRSFSNPEGNLYLTAAELKLLGGGRAASGGAVSMMAPGF